MNWLLKNRAWVLGVLGGVIYGVLARALYTLEPLRGVLSLMTLSFLVLVPVTVGYLTVIVVRDPTLRYRIFAPWLPCLLIVVIASLLAWEGAICVIMTLPVMMLSASIGGLAAGRFYRNRAGSAMVIALLPFVLGPVENNVKRPIRLQTNVAETIINAPVAEVWRQIAAVPKIEPWEQRPALFTRLGFPKPVSATLDRPGLGGVRHARFEGDVLFIEKVVKWEPDSLLSFTIDAQTDDIPPTTLDPHVTIGGDYFDILTGTYELYPIAETHTRVLLKSTHRVSTTLNLYAGWWAGLVMRSIQNNILEVIKARAERANGP